MVMPPPRSNSCSGTRLLRAAVAAATPVRVDGCGVSLAAIDRIRGSSRANVAADASYPVNIAYGEAPKIVYTPVNGTPERV